jgi:hypothetical protein
MKRMNVPLAVPSYRKLRQVIREMDIIHVQFPFFLGIRSVRIATKMKIPVISTFHIQAEHLHRQALIYVRQSTLVQVRENTASTARQYDLVQRALDLYSSVAELAADAKARAAMSAAGQKLVDGRGAARIADEVEKLVAR